MLVCSFMSQVSRFKFLAVPSRCLGHIVNLANIDVMAHITNIVVVENKTAIWEFNNALQINHVANGGLNVIMVLRTLGIKVSSQLKNFYQTNSNDIQASGACIEYFNKLQIRCGITTPLKIPLHSNIQWGTAHAILDRGNKL